MQVKPQPILPEAVGSRRRSRPCLSLLAPVIDGAMTLPILICAALLLWGWQTRLLLLAAALGAVVIAQQLTRKRLAFTPREFQRLWNVTLLLILGAGIYNGQTASISGAVLTFLQWLPILFFPFVAAHLFSNRARLPYSIFLFWWQRRTEVSDKGIDPGYPYFALCILSASASDVRDQWFYPAAVLLIACALWANRPRRLQPAVALLLLVAVTGAGYVLQNRWRSFQAELENKTMQWFVGFFPRAFEDQETHTSLGEIGKLKASGRVMMRIRAAKGSQPPRLLRQVSFDQYRRGIWLSTRRQYSLVQETEPGAWQLAAASRGTQAVRISASVPGGRILLPLPVGADSIRDLSAVRLERNRFGNLRVWDTPDPLVCTIYHDTAVSHESPPDLKDLQIPLAEEAALARILDELELDATQPNAAIEKIAAFFRDKFQYASFVKVPDLSPTNPASYISTFLLDTRAGHCEYFATAGTLLLRKAGIPARYALGYAAVEPASEGTEFRIRERHAHSWVVAYVDGLWQDFDPAPGNWNPLELQQSSMLRPLTDWWADLRFSFATRNWFVDFDRRILLFLLLPAAAVVVWTLSRTRKRSHAPSERRSLFNSYAWPGLDSEFFLAQQWLAKTGLQRKGNETSAVWLQRILPQRTNAASLRPALFLHYKYRFDPAGLTNEERELLARSVHNWLSEQTGR